MTQSLATEAAIPRHAPTDRDRQRAANDITSMVTAVASAGPAAIRAGRHGETAVIRLLDHARSALTDDVAAARNYLARAIAMLDAGSSTQSLRAEPIPVAANRGGLARWQINRITAHIDANIGSAIKATDLAALVRLSASHFFHAFKDSFAETPLAYVARRRMALAQHMMLTTDESLAQIALACGLCDQSHFTRVFRRVVGTSPHAWRREHANGPDPIGSESVRRGSNPAPGMTRTGRKNRRMQVSARPFNNGVSAAGKVPSSVTSYNWSPL